MEIIQMIKKQAGESSSDQTGKSMKGNETKESNMAKVYFGLRQGVYERGFGRMGKD